MSTVMKKSLSATDIVLVGALLAAGAVLRVFCPPIFGITPNFVICMYVLAILIVRPNLAQTIGIGFVAAAICHLTTKSMIPYLNFISEPVGAVATYFLVKGLSGLNMGRLTFKPFVVTLLGTMASGFTYISMLKLGILFVATPKNPAFLGLVTVVLTTAFANAVIAQLIYEPIVAALGKKVIKEAGK